MARSPPSVFPSSLFSTVTHRMDKGSFAESRRCPVLVNSAKGGRPEADATVGTPGRMTRGRFFGVHRHDESTMPSPVRM